MIGIKNELYLDEKVFIMRHHATMTNKQLCEAINNKRPNHKKYGLHCFRERIYELGLKSCERPRRWNARETKYLIRNYKMMGNIDIADNLNKYKNRTRDFNKKHIEKKMKTEKLKRTKKELDNIRQTNYSNGRYTKGLEAGRAKRRYPEGHIVRRNCNGVYKKVIKYQGRFIDLRRYIFMMHNGQVQPGQHIYSRDGNPLNTHPTNLTTERIVYSRLNNTNSR